MLPTVLLVAVTLIGGLAMGAVKVELASGAGVLARAAARGEDVPNLASSLSIRYRVDWSEELVCVTAYRNLLFELNEKICTRKGGL